jgi:hypothetical protein
MFDHLKKLEVRREATTWVELPEVSPKARVQVRPATEANPPYFNAMLKTAAPRARRVTRTDRVSIEDTAENRDEDRALFPRYVLVGWEGILDTAGQPVPFSSDHARDFCRALPDWLFDRIRNVAATPERFLAEGAEPTPSGTELGKA